MFDFSIDAQVKRIDKFASEFFADPASFNYVRLIDLQTAAIHLWAVVLQQHRDNQSLVDHIRFVNQELSDFIFSDRFLQIEPQIQANEKLRKEHHDRICGIINTRSI